MKSFWIVLLCAFPLLAGSVSVYAADDGRPPKKLVEDLSKRAFDGFLSVKNPQGQTVIKPEDAKTLKYPLTSYKDREMAVARGFLSGYARWCKLPWQKDYYQPYVKMLQLEHKKDWSAFQFAYTEVLHGTAMGAAEASKKGKTCDAAEKKRISALAKK